MRRTTRTRILVCLAWAAVTALPAIQAPPSTRAAGCDACLGPATKDGTTWWAPIDNFRRGGMAFRKGKLTEIVMLGAGGDIASYDLAWPMVKALDQFGTWASLAPLERYCAKEVCDDPTFDLASAKFRSRYVAFVYRSVANRDNSSLIQTLSPRQKFFFDRYVRSPGYRSDTGYFIWATEGSGDTSADRLPGISIGPYLSLGTKLLIEGDFATVEPSSTGPQGTRVYSGLPFATVQQALATADRTDYPNLVHDVNAEANLFTAVICKADGNRPRKACDRGVVKGIAKHLK